MRAHGNVAGAANGVKHGQGLRAAVVVRRAELELALAELQNSPQQGSQAAHAIEEALAGLDILLPGDVDDLSPVLSSQLAHWLEANKHLGVVELKRRRSRHAGAH